MGKKGRRTRWRTLTITDEHSDSEESNTTTSGGHRVPKGYPQKSYYSRFTYSSQSTPTRRYQCDGTKSTRSSSTASENKIQFNEDEYTRITTPRQDVLFKKGYLNKPKTYQTQTSTGNSTTSTGNSTGNGTPDHQSTDLEYESQFVFPNGFVDQNGIYYVNSFEPPYPVMVYNPPTYYTEYTSVKAKRCSTGSLTESTSPNNEEASQDLSQSETPSNVSELNHVYNVIYPGYYYNGVCRPQESVCEPEPRRVKKRRRRKVSRSKQEGTTSESSDEIFSDEEEIKVKTPTQLQPLPQEDESKEEKKEAQHVVDTEVATPSEIVEEKVGNEENNAQKSEEENDENKSTTKYDLKPDAEEFVPRAYRHPETIPMEPNVQFIKIPSNFVPVPVLNPMGEFNAFIPPGIPINFIPQNYVNFIPYKHPHIHHMEEKEAENKEDVKETVEVPKKNHIDIEKIVSKLEEAAKEQEDEIKDIIKEEAPKNLKKKKYQKVDLRRPEEGKKVWNKSPLNSPKKEEPKPLRNYSDTLKKSMVAPFCENNERNMDKFKVNKSPTKENITKNHQKVDKIAPKTSNEWIAVSRKKRKNKNVEESDQFVEESEQLVEEKTEKEEIVGSIEPKLEATLETSLTNSPPISDPVVVEIKPEEIKEVIEEKKTKKKSKKNHTKTTPPTITKRVIITDLDLSLDMKKEAEPVKIEEIKKDDELKKTNNIEEVKILINSFSKVCEVVEETKCIEVEDDVEKVKEMIVEEEPITEEENIGKEEKVIKEENISEGEKIVEEEIIEEKKEVPEKKSKKKKKKTISKSILSNQSNLNATLNVNDVSYDFLLNESLEKTNVEVSQEFDKLIQRGMYNSLEEKIKSMNMESNDNFFKTIISNISSRESSVEKSNPYITSSNLNRLITNSTTLTHNKPITTHQIRKPDDFLSATTTPNVSVEGGAEVSHDDNLYPITRAVKEWMTKTRETTPDVEILKSPSTIFREFCSEDDDSDSEITVFNHEGERKTSTSSIEEGEDVLEVYESKYGKNEDFLKIREEVEELKNNYPKHGNLPYRAICCSIM